MLAKLDLYDYFMLPGVVQIRLDGTNDPILVDILSEIDRFEGRIYVEGYYFLMDGYEIVNDGTAVYLNLHVIDNEMGDV